MTTTAERVFEHARQTFWNLEIPSFDLPTPVARLADLALVIGRDDLDAMRHAIDAGLMAYQSSINCGASRDVAIIDAEDQLENLLCQIVGRNRF